MQFQLCIEIDFYVLSLCDVHDIQDTCDTEKGYTLYETVQVKEKKKNKRIRKFGFGIKFNPSNR